ncbi:MAG: cell division protein ZapA [Burkholderiales bacterium]|jgi:cell division protein ZapA|nr:cell division protein ZapA [Burkholderiales bacterium]
MTKNKSGRSLALDVQILGRVYKVACKEGERRALMDAVELLDGNMRKIQESNRTIGIERVAVIAALNLANELLQARNEMEQAQQAAQVVPDDVARLQRRLQEFNRSIDQILNGWQ